MDGALRRGGRAPSRKRKRTSRSTPASARKGVPVYYQRPVVPRTSKQKAKDSIKFFSSGQSARMPLFAGVKPTRVRRTMGRAAGGRSVGGAFAPSADPLELQRAADAIARQQVMENAISRLAKQRGWDYKSPEEREAANQIAKATKDQLAADKALETADQDQAKIVAQAKRFREASEEEQQKMLENREDRILQSGIATKMWTDYTLKDDGDAKLAAKSIQNFDDTSRNILNRLQAATQDTTDKTVLAKIVQMQKNIDAERQDALEEYKKAINHAEGLATTVNDKGEWDREFAESKKHLKHIAKYAQHDTEGMSKAFSRQFSDINSLNDPNESAPSYSVFAHRKALQQEDYEKSMREYERRRAEADDLIADKIRDTYGDIVEGEDMSELAQKAKKGELRDILQYYGSNLDMDPDEYEDVDKFQDNVKNLSLAVEATKPTAQQPYESPNLARVGMRKASEGLKATGRGLASATGAGLKMGAGALTGPVAAAAVANPLVVGTVAGGAAAFYGKDKLLKIVPEWKKYFTDSKKKANQTAGDAAKRAGESIMQSEPIRFVKKQAAQQAAREKGDSLITVADAEGVPRQMSARAAAMRDAGLFPLADRRPDSGNSTTTPSYSLSADGLRRRPGKSTASTQNMDGVPLILRIFGGSAGGSSAVTGV